MALKYYSDSALTNEITSLTTQHDSGGEAVEVQVYLGNTDPLFEYKDILIEVEDTATPPDESDWIELALDNGGTPGAYEPPGESLAHPDISDNLSHPFWIRVTTPNLGSAQNKTDLRLKASFKEFAT